MTTTNESADVRFPIGKHRREAEVTAERRGEWIDQIAAMPAHFRALVQDLTDEQLDTPYREGGWTVRQLAHHVPDSHMNAYVRMKLGLTEDSPAVKTYQEAVWANLPDSRTTPVSVSLALLDALHERWTHLLRGLDEDDWACTVQHPEWGRIRLDHLLGIYAWHGRHHVAHVAGLRERRGW